MKRVALLISAILIGVCQAQAQSSSRFESAGGSVGELVAQGYEIKSVVLNNGKYIVFLQKERKAFACEFSRVNRSRCGEIQ
ncbi:hypothetical protein [Hoeflea sp.]|uniref:hypothetical protein n=1 Tax=Hoeflea sp. TaxID=1940281 RepID=UPI003B51DB21